VRFDAYPVLNASHRQKAHRCIPAHIAGLSGASGGIILMSPEFAGLFGMPMKN